MSVIQALYLGISNPSLQLQRHSSNQALQVRSSSVPYKTTKKSHGFLRTKKSSLNTPSEPQIQSLVDQLRECATKGSIKEGKIIHGFLIKSNIDDDNKRMVMFNHLGHLYSKCSEFDTALKVFGEMPQRNVYSFTVMITGSTDHGLFLEGVGFFREMLNCGVRPDKFAYSALLQTCIGLGSVELGKMVHAQIIKGGFADQVVLSTSLLNMYAKCGEIDGAARVFNTMNEHNQVTWNAMISGFASCDLHLEAYNQFIKMKKEGVIPDMLTFSSVLKAVAKLSDVTKGREVHDYVTELGLESNARVGTALIDMYSKCGCLKEARLVFDTNFTDCRENMPWNAMISGYSQGGCSEEALELLTRMCLRNVERDVFTFASSLNAVATSKCLQFGREVHAMVVKLGVVKLGVVSCALADAYSKCGSLKDATLVFEKMEEKDLISWTTMVTAHATCSEEEEKEKAIGFFSEMREAGFTPNQFTYASILVGVRSLCLLEYGRQIHGLICKTGMDTQDCVESALVDMYSKCGNISDAEKVFEKIKDPDVVSWTALISGYAQHGFAEKAVELFKRMYKKGIRVNAVTLLAVLFACSHGGMVEQGLHYFQVMEKRFNVVPEMEHYACVVDLLGRVGRLDDALDFINNMPVPPTDMVWQTLLGACRVHGNIELAEKAAKQALSVRPGHSGTYVLLSNTYTEGGSVEDGLSLRNVMKNRGVKKEPGLSWITVGGTVHKFFSGDQNHPEKDKIYAILDGLREKMRAMGYVPELRYVQHEAEE